MPPLVSISSFSALEGQNGIGRDERWKSMLRFIIISGGKHIGKAVASM